MYAWVQDVPIGRSVYGDIMEGLGSETPDGLLLHLAYETEAGGLRYVDIWRDREACDRFCEDQLHPIVHPLLESANVHLDGEPPRVEIGFVHMWGGSLTAPVWGGAVGSTPNAA